MTLARLSCSDTAAIFAPIRALRSLRLRDAEIITQVVGPIGGAWTVQTFDDYDGYLSILVEPCSQGAEQRPSYLVSGKTGNAELIAVDGDQCQTLGHFGDIYGLAAELTSRLLAFVVQAAQTDLLEAGDAGGSQRGCDPGTVN